MTPRIVNRSSRICALAVVALTVLAPIATAQADRVIFVEATGNAAEERTDAVMEALLAAAQSLGHDAQILEWDREVPQTAEDMRALAEARGATYLVVPQINAMPGQYRLILRVGYAPGPRVEELEANVVEAEQEARLRDILGAMLRPEGLGEDAERLAGGQAEDPDAAAREQREREERERLERERLAREEAARRDFEAREAERRAQARARAAERWENRERYADDAERPWLGQIGLGGHSLLARPEQSRGSPWIGVLNLRLGHGIDGARGLELRGGADIYFGGTSGVAAMFGGVYTWAPWTVPVFLGAQAEAGALLLTSGAQNVRLVMRGGFAGIWHAGPRFYVEAALPELTLITGGPPSLALGMSARAGVRF